jgi:hypothetical protein
MGKRISRRGVLQAGPLAVTDPSALTCSVNGPGTIPPAGSVTG